MTKIRNPYGRTIASIHQPLYLPWCGYLHKMAVSDVHIILDDVEFDDESFVKRNRVRTPDGWTWLTVPVHASQGTTIQEVEVANEHRWQSTHWKTLNTFYANAPHFGDHRGFFESIYQKDWMRLADLNLEMINYLRDQLEIETPLIRSSEIGAEGSKTDLILDLCEEAEVDIYLSGPNGRDYLDSGRFQERGVELIYHDFTHPTYDQVFDGFESHMSAIDLLFNCGPNSWRVLMEPNRTGEEIEAEVTS